MKIRMAFLALVFATPVFAATQAWTVGTNPTAPSYNPVPGLTYNPSGGPVIINRQSMGKYRVVFTNLAPIGSGGNAQTSPYGQTPAFAACRTRYWTTAGPQIAVYVECYTAAGAPLDTQFSLLFTRQ